MSITRTRIGDRIRHTVALAAGEHAAIELDSLDRPSLTIQVHVGTGDAAIVVGTLDDASAFPLFANPFPLVGEDGHIPAGALRTVAIVFPGPLRTVHVTAPNENAGTVRVVVLQ